METACFSLNASPARDDCAADDEAALTARDGRRGRLGRVLDLPGQELLPNIVVELWCSEI